MFDIRLTLDSRTQATSPESHLARQEHINEVQRFGLGLGLEEVIHSLILEGATPLLDDSVCEVVHHAAGLAEAPSVRAEIVQEVRVQKDLVDPLSREAAELQNGGNVFAGLPAGWRAEREAKLCITRASAGLPVGSQWLCLMDKLQLEAQVELCLDAPHPLSGLHPISLSCLYFLVTKNSGASVPFLLFDPASGPGPPPF